MRAPILAILFSCTALLAGCAADPGAAEFVASGPIGDHGPIYPPNMEKARQEGYVVMDCTITASGLARDCKVTEATNLDFAEAAEAYVAGHRYRPATYDGTPVAVSHHRLRINFMMPSQLVRLTYDCEVAATGHVRNCRSLSVPKPVPQALQDVVQAQLGVLSVAPRKIAGQAVAEPHRTIEVVMGLQINPSGHPRMPTLPPVQAQVNLLLDCRADSLPRCQEISEPPADAKPNRTDRIIRVSFGVNGIFPTGEGHENEPGSAATPAAARSTAPYDGRSSE